MSEDAAEPQGSQQQDATTPAETAEVQQVDQTDWKAEARKWEKRAKTNSHAEKERAQLADRLSAMESELAESRRKAEQAEHANQVADWKQAAASEHGVPAEVLRGDTAEEISAHAEAIKAWRGKAAFPVVPDAGAQPASNSGQKSFLNDLFGRS